MDRLPCTHCRVPMACGNCFECKQCKNSQLCDKCIKTEKEMEDGERHPIILEDKHIIYPSELKEVPHATKDEDEIVKSDCANTRRVLKDEKRKMLVLLVHSSRCCDSGCQFPNCRKVKGLVLHGLTCEIRVSGGCILCKKMWCLLSLHARTCQEPECLIPRCRDLKEHLQQSDSRRRAAASRTTKEDAKTV